MNIRGRVIGIAILLVIIAAASVAAYHFWYQPTYDFVEVTDAQVTGDLTQVGAPASGQVMDLYFNVGDSVHLGDTVATIKVVAPASPASVGPSVSRLLTRVASPLTGRIAARIVSVGDTVSPGQALMTIADLTDLWIEADVDEARIGQVAPGKVVDVTLGAYGKVLPGTVVQVGSATTEVTAPSIGGFGSSDTTKKIPVRIRVDWAGVHDLTPVPGMTADVVIHVR